MPATSPMNPVEAIRHLRTALGVNGEITVDGTTYAVMRAQVRYVPGGSPERANVLMARRGDGADWVAVEQPRSQGRRARDIRITRPRTDGTGVETVRVVFDPAVQNATVAAAPTILRAQLQSLTTQAEPWATALITYITTCRDRGRDVGSATSLDLSDNKAGDDVGKLTKVILDRRSQITSLRATVRNEASRFAKRVMDDMSAQPARVAAFAELGYVVKSLPAQYGDETLPVPMLTHNGVCVQREPAEAPNSVGLKFRGVSAIDEAAAAAFIGNAEAVVSVERTIRVTPIATAPAALEAAGVDSVVAVAFVKRALGDGGTLTIGDVTYENRVATVSDEQGTRQTTVLFRVGPRDPRLPEPLASLNAAEWPLGARTVVSTVNASSDAAHAYGDSARIEGTTATCVDRGNLEATGYAVAAEAREIVRAIYAQELARFEEARGVLAMSPSSSGQAAAELLGFKVPPLSEGMSLETMTQSVESLRGPLFDEACDAAIRESASIANGLVDLLSYNRDIYKAARERGYRVVNVDVDYVVGGRTLVRGQSLLSLSHGDGDLQLLQPPDATLTDVPGSTVAYRWRPLSRETALQMARDAAEFNGMKQRAVAARQAARSGMGE